MMALVSGTGAAGMSCVPLSGGGRLGPDGAGRLADALREARAGLLTGLDLRCRHVTRAQRDARQRWAGLRGNGMLAPRAIRCTHAPAYHFGGRM